MVTSWGSTSSQILELRDFLEREHVTTVVMEAPSGGLYVADGYDRLVSKAVSMAMQPAYAGFSVAKEDADTAKIEVMSWTINPDDIAPVAEEDSAAAKEQGVRTTSSSRSRGTSILICTGGWGRAETAA